VSGSALANMNGCKNPDILVWFGLESLPL